MKKVLIVEDEPMILEIWQELLATIECEAEVAKDGAVGLSKVTSNYYDLVITDYKMPVKDGTDLINYLGENHKDSKIILVSGFEIQEEELQELKVDHFIQKPFDIHHEMAIIRNLLA